MHSDIEHKQPSIKVDTIYQRDPKIRGPQVVDDLSQDSVVPTDSKPIKVSTVDKDTASKNSNLLKDTQTSESDTNKSMHDSSAEHRHSYTLQNIVFSFISYICICSVVAYIILTKFPAKMPDNRFHDHSCKSDFQFAKGQDQSSKPSNFSSIISSFVSQHRKLDDDLTEVDECMFSTDAPSR